MSDGTCFFCDIAKHMFKVEYSNVRSNLVHAGISASFTVCHEFVYTLCQLMQYLAFRNKPPPDPCFASLLTSTLETGMQDCLSVVANKSSTSSQSSARVAGERFSYVFACDNPLPLNPLTASEPKVEVLFTFLCAKRSSRA